MEETIEFPETDLRAFVERVVVTLSALHLLTKEQPGGDRRRRHGLVVEMRDEEIRGAVLVGPTLGGDKVRNDVVPAAVLGETRSQKLLERLAVDLLDRDTTDEQVGPLSRQIAGIFRTVQEAVDHLPSLVGPAIRQERL